MLCVYKLMLCVYEKLSVEDLLKSLQQTNNGLDLTAAIDYVKFLSTEAAKYNLAIGLKNAGDIIGDVLKHVDFAVNE